MSSPEAERDVELLAACIDALQTAGPGAVDALLAGHPERADLVRARLDKLAAAGLLTPIGEQPRSIPEELGDYRLLRCIGSGGMGVVYLAEQRSLGRTVALKLLRPEQRYFPGAAARFRREIEAVARLGDPGIVPIYTVGEEQGVEYFTMEHVRGATLADVVAAHAGHAPADLRGEHIARVAALRAEGPSSGTVADTFAGSWLEASCRIVARMARAVHHAHERGIVHRDLKPNNAMVTPEGRVLLLDFGLASADGSSRITRTGAVLGTLHYMAPEQLLGGDVDARTDVYALGATLHELIALAPPFAANSSEGLRHAILHGERERLSRRHVDAPRDVETIVAKAMAREVQHRYASAAALADDLDRFLMRRPILARPAGPWLRLHRYALRHPAKATAVLLLLAALVATPFLVRITRGQAEAQIAAERARARSNLEGAVRALETMVQTARSGAAARTPGLDVERIHQVEVAVGQIRALRRDNPDPLVRAAFARGMLRAAELRALLGSFAEALADLEHAEEELAALAAANPRDAHWLRERIAARLVRGTILVGLDSIDDAVANWQAALDAAAELDLDQTPAPTLLALASCHNNLGRVAHSRGDAAATADHLAACMALEARVPRDTLQLEQRLDMQRTRLNLAALQREQRDFAGARNTLLAVSTVLQAEVTTDRPEPELVRELARTRFAIAQLDADVGDGEAAATGHRAAYEQLERLVQDFPDRVVYRQELGTMAFEASSRASARRDLVESRRWIDLALQQHETLLQSQPDSAEVLSELATFLGQSSALALVGGDPERALAELGRGVELLSRALARRPGDAHFEAQLGTLHQHRATVCMRSERWSEARVACLAALAAYDRASASDPKAIGDERRLPWVLQTLAQVELMCDDFDGVMRAVQRLQQVRPMQAQALREFGQKLHVAEREDFQALVRAADDRGR